MLIAKSPAKAVFPLAAATVNLSVFTAKSPVELKLVFVDNEPSTVIAVPDSETIESAITCVADHLVKFPGVPVPSTCEWSNLVHWLFSPAITQSPTLQFDIPFRVVVPPTLTT